MINKKIYELYGNPRTIQHNLLSNLEETILNGDMVVDANNVTAFCLEAFSTMTSDCIREVDDSIRSIYAVRANDMGDLYKLMSDFDYVGLFSEPAKSAIELQVQRDYLVDNAVLYNENYSKIVIPRDSVIELAGHTFGIYYPIEIRVNNNTGSISVFYDTTEQSPFQGLSSHNLEHIETEVSGVVMSAIKIPIFQISREVDIRDVIPDTSFIKDYPYTDKFYAARVHHFKDNAWHEMDLTLSDKVYDPMVPTAKLTVLSDQSKLKVIIPQVYFTEKLVGSRIKVTILTTEGEVDIDISAIQQEAISAKFPMTNVPEVDKYISPINRPEAIQVVPMGSKIVGGTNGAAFNDIKRRVITNTLHDPVPVTSEDLKVFFTNKGFNLGRYADGITNRIYFAHTVMTDSSGDIIGSSCEKAMFNRSFLDASASVIDNGNGSYVILPTQVYKFDERNKACLPLTDDHMAVLTSMHQWELIEEMNNNQYTASPFHIWLDTNSRFPLAYAYDFTNPSASLQFIGENVNTSAKLMVFDAEIIYDVTGYRIRLTTIRTDDMKEVDPSDLLIVATAADETGTSMYMEVEHVGTANGVDFFDIVVNTSFKMSSNHGFAVENAQDITGIGGKFSPLESKISLVCMVRSSLDFVSNYPTDVGKDIAMRYGDFTPVAEQALTVTYGRRIDELFTDVDVLYTGQEYERYSEDMPLLYPQDVYKRDGEDKLIYPLVIEHNQGDHIHSVVTVFLDEDTIRGFYGSFVDGSIEITEDTHNTYVNTTQTVHTPRYVYRKDQIVLGADRVPIVSKEREMIFNVSTIQYDKKLELSQEAQHANFIRNVRELLRSYFTPIKETEPQLLEQTEVYFRPNRTLGSGTFVKDTDVTEQLPLQISMGFKVYIYPFVYKDAKRKLKIETVAMELVDKAIASGEINCTDIAKELKLLLSESIKHVDVKGINGDPELQTLISTNRDSVPSLKHILYQKDDGTTSVRRALDIDFVTVT